MLIDHLITSYAAWFFAALAPVWLGSYLYRSIMKTIGVTADNEEEAGTLTPQLLLFHLPALPAHEPSIHLPTAA